MCRVFLMHVQIIKVYLSTAVMINLILILILTLTHVTIFKTVMKVIYCSFI